TITKTYKVRALRQYKISYISENIGELMFIPAGSFQRDEGEENISVITKPYSLSKYQITRQQFLDVMGEDPSDIGSATSYYDPVQMVNWYHAIAFCNKLSLLEDLSPAYTVSGVSDWENLDYSSIPINLNRDWDAATCNWDATGYRLPTEMEWMWAAMGADQDAREGVKQGEINETGYTKDYAGQGYGLGTSVDDYACYSCSNIQNIICPDFFYEGTEAVGKKLPNELGLYDMSGNVWEWCWDWWDSYPTDTQADYKGIDFELSTNDVVPPSRVLRGGSRCGDGSDCSVAFRLCHFPYFQSDTFGFRVLRPIQ
ncbi:MAG TPA: SUMF1/EgtB/PvdO family nonheme iron enzyme, partial [Salinivirgaceae bacterium]|nr:SUMF1/EgtB/PvdO family nonheme iron enzyme [Salinivirgaceae bacterium]